MARYKKNASGYYCETFTFDGKRIAVRSKDRDKLAEKVQAKKEELRRAKEKADILYTDEMTLEQYHSMWEERRKGTVKQSTIRNQSMWYKGFSETVIDRESGLTFGELKLSQITTATVYDLQRVLKEAKQKDGQPKYTTNTINCYINLLKHILGDAVNEEIILKNPARVVKNLVRTEAKARDTIHRALTVEETEMFLEAAKESFYLNHFRFMLLSGVRCGELGAIKYTDINHNENRLEIKRTITKAESGVYVLGDTTKTADGKRNIPLSEKMLSVIEDQKIIQRALNPGTIRFDGLAFTSPEGHLLNNTCVNREIKRICKRAGVEVFTAHCFRDTFATRAIENGMNPKTLQEILGHADISITMNLYAHVMEETKKNEMQKVVDAICI